jgi:hypothetical protein
MAAAHSGTSERGTAHEKNKHSAATVSQEVQYLPLHRQLHHVCETFPDQWREHVLGGSRDCAAFWNSLRADDPRWTAFAPLVERRAVNAQCSTTEALRRCVPLALHADGVPVFKGKSLVVFSASSILSNSSAADAKFLIEAHWKHQTVKGNCAANDTEYGVWQCALWDLRALFEGAHPAVDHTGKRWAPGTAAEKKAGAPIADSWWAVAWIFKGDLDHFANHLGLSHWSTETPCSWCPANRHTLPWTDFRELAEWKVAEWTPAMWRAWRTFSHPLFSLQWFSIANVAIDILHVLSLGVAQHIAGSVLHALC